jgi:hypothetical protein
MLFLYLPLTFADSDHMNTATTVRCAEFVMA